MDKKLAVDRNAAARARARDTLVTAGANYEAARSRLLQAIRSYRRVVVGQPSTTETIHTLAHSSLSLGTTGAIDRLLPSAPGSAQQYALDAYVRARLAFVCMDSFMGLLRAVVQSSEPHRVARTGSTVYYRHTAPYVGLYGPRRRNLPKYILAAADGPLPPSTLAYVPGQGVDMATLSQVVTTDCPVLRGYVTSTYHQGKEYPYRLTITIM